ncbi:SnoaL-like protein [Sinobacterium caligoides]|uniref:SnoaL-like protein n=1 Tax=Sinobacterium caligoides TaxID=933926 RepID=A0A3N2D5H3_9GAMM|nr:nuclear transport factor 2 family protein [Sinobacterium caligoides]ROR94942.1 SnoaL-like protein [Sinobacterium caligoides]
MDDYRQIETLIYRYAELIDAGKLTELAKLFRLAEFYRADGELSARGEEAFLALQQRAVRLYNNGTPCTKHVTSNVIIELSPSSHSATARSYFSVLQAVEGFPLQTIIAGRYLDSFARIEGVWQFKKRQVIPELIGDLSHHLLFDITTEQQ